MIRKNSAQIHQDFGFFQPGNATGPFRPGDPEYDELVGLRGTRDELYLLRFPFNSDPGRGAKYAGSAMIVIGIALVYGLRGRNSRKRTGQQAASSAR